MTSLLRKFRINYSAVIEITGIGKKPSQERYYHYLTKFIITVDNILPCCGGGGGGGGGGG